MPKYKDVGKDVLRDDEVIGQFFADSNAERVVVLLNMFSGVGLKDLKEMAKMAEEAAKPDRVWDWKDEKVQNDPAFHAWIEERANTHGDVLGSTRVNSIFDECGYVTIPQDQIGKRYAHSDWWWKVEDWE